MVSISTQVDFLKSSSWIVEDKNPHCLQAVIVLAAGTSAMHVTKKGSVKSVFEFPPCLRLYLIPSCLQLHHSKSTSPAHEVKLTELLMTLNNELTLQCPRSKRPKLSGTTDCCSSLLRHLGNQEGVESLKRERQTFAFTLTLFWTFLFDPNQICRCGPWSRTKT